LGFGVWGLGFKVWDLKYIYVVFWFGFWDLGFVVFWFGFWNFGFMG
jgi:hypothetical protein